MRSGKYMISVKMLVRYNARTGGSVEYEFQIQGGVRTHLRCNQSRINKST